MVSIMKETKTGTASDGAHFAVPMALSRCPTKSLIQSFHGKRHAEVAGDPDIGFVDAHPEGTRGNHARELILKKGFTNTLALTHSVSPVYVFTFVLPNDS